MKVGAMNHPAKPLAGEIAWIAAMGLEFIDLTLEPPAAGPWQIDLAGVRRALKDSGLGIVGHTAYYLPLGHPFESVRRGAVEAFVACAGIFAELGASVMNIHPDPKAPMHDRAYIFERNLLSLQEIALACRPLGITLMIENLPSDFNSAEQLAPFLSQMPELGLHLDLGHTNLRPEDSAESILSAWGTRLQHVHLHDNLGGTADLHLPLGAGTVDLPRSLRALKGAGYDGTITLEVFAPDPEYLRYSASQLRRFWREI